MQDNPVTAVVATVVGISVTVWSLWATWVAFTGGTVPLVGWELEGGLGTGLLWLFVLTPLFEGIAMVLAALIAAPIAMLVDRMGRGG